jgi:hypothetical protein
MGCDRAKRFSAVTDQILFLRAHLCGGNTQSQRLKNRVIPKSILTNWSMKDVALKPTFGNLFSTIWQNQ